jgi:hypothetical protein
MITTVADLLEALVEREKNLLAKQPKLNHAPMLGDMYEGLTRSFVEKALFKGLNLRVVEGKIEDSKGKLSDQIDCMIVEGDGHQLPHTDHYIYPYDRVIAVMEIKKSFRGTELSDSFFHLRGVKDENAQSQKHVYRLLRDAWRSLVGRDLPEREEVKTLPEADQALYCILVSEVYRPLRVVLGYFGYKSEFQLRRGMMRFLAEQLAPVEAPKETVGFGINSFPNQIICGNSSLIKLDGMPFSSRLLTDGSWPFLASRGEQPLHVFLELLWTRLAYRYCLDSTIIFGDDLECEGVHVLLEAKWYGKGWAYRSLEAPEKELSQPLNSIKWEPAILTLAEFVLLNELCGGQQVRLDNAETLAYLNEQGTTKEAICQSLAEKRLAYEKSGQLHLLTDQCQCAILPDGRYVAGENKSGRLMRWVLKFGEQYSLKTQSASS